MLRITLSVCAVMAVVIRAVMKSSYIYIVERRLLDTMKKQCHLVDTVVVDTDISIVRSFVQSFGVRNNTCVITLVVCTSYIACCVCCWCSIV